jgi:hypothetical protein
MPAKSSEAKNDVLFTHPDLLVQEQVGGTALGWSQGAVDQ